MTDRTYTNATPINRAAFANQVHRTIGVVIDEPTGGTVSERMARISNPDYYRCPICGQRAHPTSTIVPDRCVACERALLKKDERPTPRYRIAVQLNGNYYAPFDADQEMSERDCIARLNEQDRELAALRETERQLRAELVRRNDDVQGLRIQLDDAHQHVGALLGLPHAPASISVLVAARAWLRRVARS